MRNLTTGRRGTLLVLALAAAVAGAVLLMVGVRAQQSAPRPHSVGSIAPAPSPGRSSTGAAPDQGPKPLGPSRPLRITIPAIGVSSVVNPIGLAPDGTLAVPQPGPHLDEAAWFRNSPTPGQPGPSIIEGHVDSVEGPSIFFRLGDVRPGDRIRVRRADGVRLVFTVDAIRDFPKSRFPTRVVYGGELSVPQLRLITCSDFNDTTHHHEGNEVVFSHLSHTARPKEGKR